MVVSSLGLGHHGCEECSRGMGDTSGLDTGSTVLLLVLAGLIVVPHFFKSNLGTGR